MCLNPNRRPATEFVGLTVAQVRRRAATEGAHFRIYGAAGRCLSQLADAAVGAEFAVTIDALNQRTGAIPDNAHVLTAYWIRKPR